MTATKRRRPIVFAIACALVLTGGSLEAATPHNPGQAPQVPMEETPGYWSLIVTSVSGTSGTSNASRAEKNKVHVDFLISGRGKPIDGRSVRVCAGFVHEHTGPSRRFRTDECVENNDLSKKGSGRFRADFATVVWSDLAEQDQVTDTTITEMGAFIWINGKWVRSEIANIYKKVSWEKK